MCDNKTIIIITSIFYSYYLDFFLIMQYLAMIRTEQPQYWVFEESRDINEMMFRFKDKERPQSYAQTLANR